MSGGAAGMVARAHGEVRCETSGLRVREDEIWGGGGLASWGGVEEISLG